MAKMMEPFYDIIKNAKHELAPKHVLESENYAERFRAVMQQITGKEVPEIVFVSEQSLGRPEYMIQVDKSWTTLQKSFHLDMRNALWDMLSVNLSDELGSNLWDALTDSHMEILPAYLQARLYKNTRSLLWDSLWYFHGFALVNAETSAYEDIFHDIQNLITLLPKGLPYGVPDINPDITIVICK